jgi:hypothetical protein
MSDTITESAQQTDAGATGGTQTGSSTQPANDAGATLTQEQFNAAIAAEKRRWKAEQAQAETRAKQEAEDAARAAQGEFQALAEQRQQRITALETEHATTAERLTAYEAEMERQIKARLRALPEEIRAMAPEGDALARYAWLEKAETAAAKLAATRTPGTPSGPRGTGAAGSVATNNDDLIAKKRASIGGL